jgi:hypothetical protein
MNFRSQISDLRFLRRYFYSGWAFFMPYLFFYLFYDWRKWPVNPLPDHALGSGGHIPALLHVYWALHIIHLVFGLLALRTWWSETKSGFPNFPLFHFSAFLPWLLLALIFYIPGVYLEWPSDPWEHLHRINEWHVCQTVGAHSTWVKSSYFFAYSLLGWAFGLRQLFWLDFYYTGICLLLCWQYYRLSRVVGLGEQASLVFVILQALLFGNNIFSFYRYYGISSSIYAQLGAIALTRLGIDLAKPKSFVIRHSSFVIGECLPSFLWSLASVICLLALIAFNHAQGLGIAALGLAAIGVWRLIEWKRSMLWWLAATALILSAATVILGPHHRSLDQLYRPSGWFAVWDGFDGLSPKSPAGDRALQILGFSGVINLAAGLLLLLRRNHIAGWLTVMPMALCLPFARVVAPDVIVFQRMLLAFPAGLALVCLGQQFFSQGISRTRPEAPVTGEAKTFYCLLPDVRFSSSILPIAVISLATLMVVPVSGPFYNRTWNSLEQSPKDLNMQGAWGNCDDDRPSSLHRHNALVAATSGLSFLLEAQRPVSTIYSPHAYRIYDHDGRSPVTDLELMRNTLAESEAPSHTVLITLQPASFYTAFSLAALCSGHWLPQEAVLAASGTNELRTMCANSGLSFIDQTDGLSSHQENPSHWEKSCILLRSYHAGQMPGSKPARQNNGGAPLTEPELLVGHASATAPLVLTTGRFLARVRPVNGFIGWACLLAIDSSRMDREIYIYIDSDTNQLYYSFSNNTIGPARIELTPNLVQGLEFRWTDHRQQLLLDGRVILESKFPAPQATLKRVFIGWQGSNEIWHGGLKLDELSVN